MDYGEIINSSFRLSWRYKSLWIFGLFAFGFTFPSFNWTDRFKGSDFSGIAPGTFDGLHLDTLGPMIILFVVLIVLLMIAISILASAISTPALVDAVNRITRGGQYRFKTTLKTGVQYMWRTLALMVLAFFAIVFFMGVLFGFGAIAFVIHWGLGVLSLLVLIPMFLIGAFIVTTVVNLAYRSIVVRDVTITEAVGEGIELLKRHTWPCVVMALVYLGLAIGVGITAMIVGLIVAIPFFAIAMMSHAGLITALLIGIPVFWLVMLPISGFLGTAFESMYTIFYFRLYEPPTQQTVAAQPGMGPTA